MHNPNLKLNSKFLKTTRFGNSIQTKTLNLKNHNNFDLTSDAIDHKNGTFWETYKNQNAPG